MDNFKKYLQKHSEDLDTDGPGEAVGQRLRNSINTDTAKPKVISLLWRYAAAACILAFVATSTFYLGKRGQDTNTANNLPAHTGSGTVNRLPVPPASTDSNRRKEMVALINKPTQPDNANGKKSVGKKASGTRNKPATDPSLLIVQDVERNYAQLVNLKLKRLRVTQVHAESPQYFSTFKQQLKQIEDDEVLLKIEIRQQGLTDGLLQQLININQQKLNVLKDLQAEIGKLNAKTKDPENRSSTNTSYFLNL